MEKEFSTARNSVRKMLKSAGNMEPYPQIASRLNSAFTTREPTAPLEDDGVHADPIQGLRSEPVYIEQQ